jgi:hypothetical protein
MKQSINFSAFVDAFHAYKRYDQFGYDALKVIFDYLEEYEESSDQEIELDVIAICCDYNVQHYSDIARDYDIDIEGMDEDEAKQHVMNYLCDNTTVLGETEDTCNFVYQVF